MGDVEPERLAQPLRCAECGSVGEGDSRGWKAYRGFDRETGEVETFIFCPECAEREFGSGAE